MDTPVNAVIEKKLEHIDPLFNSVVLYTPVAYFKQGHCSRGNPINGILALIEIFIESIDLFILLQNSNV